MSSNGNPAPDVHPLRDMYNQIRQCIHCYLTLHVVELIICTSVNNMVRRYGY